jgi:hypothetical protein
VNFTFSLDTGSAPLTKVLNAWAAWRHDGEISNGGAVAQPSVEAALDVMLAALGKKDKIERVWIYADGDDQGRMVAAFTKSGYRAGIDPSQATQYAQGSDRCKKLVNLATDKTSLHLLGCHANLSRQSLGAWRDVFTGAKGTVTAPDGLWQLALRSESWTGMITVDQKQGCTPKTVTIAPKDRAEYQAGLRRVESTADSLVAAGCLTQERADTIKEKLGADVIRTFDRLLQDWFDLLRPAGELPVSLRGGAASHETLLARMWTLWGEAGGIAFPFVGKKRVGLAATRGKKPKDLVVDKALAAILPSDASWTTTFVTRPMPAKTIAHQVTVDKKTNKRAIVGGLRLSEDTLKDVIPKGSATGGLLFTTHDLDHVGFLTDGRLEYEAGYSDPEDPFRWRKVQDIVDSGYLVDVQRITQSTSFPAIMVEGGNRATGEFTLSHRNIAGTAITLAPEVLATQRSADLGDPVFFSADNRVHIYYTKDDLAHELLGHTWLLIKGLPWLHHQTITSDMGVMTPLGEAYAGTVIEFQRKYVNPDLARKSPTAFVSANLLATNLAQFKDDFGKKSTGAMNEKTTWPEYLSAAFNVVAANYEAAPPTGGGKAITRASIIQELTSWYSGLNPDERYRFLYLLNTVPLLALASDLAATLPQPAGMGNLHQVAPPP